MVNADDFGLSEGVNRGIEAAHVAGVVTSASLMVNLPSFEDAVARAPRLPTLGIGLHFNLTAGAPVAPPRAVASLVDRRSGAFASLPRLVLRALAGRIRPAHVAAECAAQLGRLRAAGLTPTHFDGHRHVHALPGVWAPAVATARAAGIRMVRVPVEPPPLGPAGLRLALLAASWRVAARDGRPPGAVRVRGLALRGTRTFATQLLRLLDRLPSGTIELVVHPGYADGGLVRWDVYTGGRERELAALLSPEVRDRITRGDFVLRHFGQL